MESHQILGEISGLCLYFKQKTNDTDFLLIFFSCFHRRDIAFKE